MTESVLDEPARSDEGVLLAAAAAAATPATIPQVPQVPPVPRPRARARGKWPIPAPGVPRRLWPSPVRAAAAARLPAVVQNAAAEPEVPQPSPKEDTRHLRVVPPRTLSPAQRRRRARALLLAAAGLVAVVAFGLVYLHVVLAQRQFALDQLTQKVQTDRSTYERLRVQVAQLGSPANIISRAEGKLGMRQPASVTYLTPPVTIGGPAATATPARPATGQVEAPAGIADWPQIKAQLAGSP